jgi:hypothetical protein
MMALSAPGAFVQFDLPVLSQPFGPLAMSHLPDGRLVYAESGSFYLQDAFGLPALTPFTGEPAVDPSFIAVHDGSLAVAGGGGFGSSLLHRFDPATPAAPGFASFGAPVQNYQGVFRDADGLYVSGLYSGTTHGVQYVPTNGGAPKVIVENVSTYSAGMTRDAAGNLYVGDNDNGVVYRFTSAQLAAAIAGLALTPADGVTVHDFGGGGNIGSLAVDDAGNLWAAGWQANGIKVYRPSIGDELTLTPGFDNANYYVASFTRNGESYIAYVNQENPFSGNSRQVYGFDLAAQAIPEPHAAGLLVLGALALSRRRRHA